MESVQNGPVLLPVEQDRLSSLSQVVSDKLLRSTQLRDLLLEIHDFRAKLRISFIELAHFHARLRKMPLDDEALIMLRLQLLLHDAKIACFTRTQVERCRRFEIHDRHRAEQIAQRDGRIFYDAIFAKDKALNLSLIE